MKQYLKTFSRREIWSAIFSALMICMAPVIGASIGVIVSLFPFSDTFLFSFMTVIISLVILSAIALSHHFYLLEHKRANNLGGRIMQDALIEFFFVVISLPILFFTNIFSEMIGYVSNLIIVVVGIMLSSEILLSIIYTLSIDHKLIYRMI